MHRLEWTAEARADRFDIWLHIALDSEAATERLMDDIDGSLDLLLDFPKMGRPRDELLPDLRSWPVGDYLIFYRIIGDAVRLLRIVHGSRDLTDLFGL